MRVPSDWIPSRYKDIFETDKQALTQPVSFKLPTPYSDWQRDLMTSKCRTIITLNGTKTGKTLGGSGRISFWSYQTQQNQSGIFRIIAPGYRQSGYTYKYLKRLFPSRLIYQPHLTSEQNRFLQSHYDNFKPRRTDSKMQMVWPHNGALIECLHAKDPESTIEGERCQGVLLDEASKMHEQVFASSMSTVSQTGGWLAMTTTPRGRRHWTANLFLEIREEMQHCEKKGIPYSRLAYSVPTSSSPYVKASVIENARRTLPDRIFRQLYLAEIVDDGSVFVGHSSLVEGPPLFFEDRERWLSHDHSRQTVVVGVDWARKGDWTVCTAWTYQEQKPRMVGFYRLQGERYKDIVHELVAFLSNFSDVHYIRHDQTGIGEVIREYLEGLPFAYDGVVFNNQIKADFVQSLEIMIRDAKASLPNWPAMISELDDFDCTTTALGTFKYEASTGHDDIVISMALGWSLVNEMKGSTFEVINYDDIVSDLIEDEDEDDELDLLGE